MIINELFVHYRRKHEFSQREVAEMTGVHPRTVQAVELGRYAPSWRYISAFVLELGVPLPELKEAMREEVGK